MVQRFYLMNIRFKTIAKLLFENSHCQVMCENWEIILVSCAYYFRSNDKNFYLCVFF